MSKAERGLDVDHLAERGRDACDPPCLRKHEDYRKPRWATCHVDGVDRIFAAASDDDGTAQIRIDIDGVGGHTASLHDVGENINLSVFITPDQIEELVDALDDAREDGENRWWPSRTDWSEGDA